MFDDLNGKVGIITGGNGRLGKVYAQALGRANTIHLLDTQPTCEHAIGNIHYHQADLTDEAAVNAAVDAVVAQHGRVDFLVNNAALQITKPFHLMSVAEFRQSIDVNLNGAYIAIKAVSKPMMARREGVIVNIGSIYGIVSADPTIYGDSGLNSPDAYAASKSGLIHLTRYLAVNLAKYNIRVNALSPAGVFNQQPESFMKNYLPKVPMGRMLDREELVGPLSFLLSKASSYVTGHNLVVDGGFTAM